MLAPLDNQVIFKIAFTNMEVFTGFVKDIIEIDIIVGKIETEKKFTPKIGNIDFSYDIFALSLHGSSGVAKESCGLQNRTNRLYNSDANPPYTIHTKTGLCLSIFGKGNNDNLNKNIFF